MSPASARRSVIQHDALMCLSAITSAEFCLPRKPRAARTRS